MQAPCKPHASLPYHVVVELCPPQLLLQPHHLLPSCQLLCGHPAALTLPGERTLPGSLRHGLPRSQLRAPPLQSQVDVRAPRLEGLVVSKVLADALRPE